MPFRVVPQRDRKLNRLIREGRESSYTRGEEIYAAGAAADELFVVRAGHVRLVLPPGGHGNERVAAVAGPGELFGEEALRAAEARLLGARAGEPAVTVALPGPRTLRALRTTTHTLPLLLRACARDLAGTRWSGPGSGGPPAALRLADLLLELARRLGRSEGHGGEEIRIPHWFTHQELADMIGSHRSTVTTRINEWIYEGIVRDDDHALLILRPGALKKRSSGREAWLSGR